MQTIASKKFLSCSVIKIVIEIVYTRASVAFYYNNKITESDLCSLENNSKRKTIVGTAQKPPQRRVKKSIFMHREKFFLIKKVRKKRICAQFTSTQNKKFYFTKKQWLVFQVNYSKKFNILSEIYFFSNSN